MSKSKRILLPVISFGIILAFALILIIPSSREWFKEMSNTHPYVMGFVKFAFLATVGEIFAFKIAKKEWGLPVKTGVKFIIWGIIGLWITYMMKVFGSAMAALMNNGLLPNPQNPMLNTFLRALFTSLTMNLSFAPTFMAIHKCSDKYLELKSQNADKSTESVIKSIDWVGFVKFTLFKTVPIFWIPAHTITFMLPAEYQVIMAAALSVALGIILSLKK
ncbi:MAG: hypothetical protein IJQ50_02165 [Clostridia bacterium]|nr:hypothetical protein [Clostridia bacterium]